VDIILERVVKMHEGILHKITDLSAFLLDIDEWRFEYGRTIYSLITEHRKSYRGEGATSALSAEESKEGGAVDISAFLDYFRDQTITREH